MKKTIEETEKSSEPRPPLAARRASGPVKPIDLPVSFEKLKIAFDITLMRPGCALLQAAFGCPGTLADLFPPDTWLLAPTENLRVYHIQREQLAQLVQKTRDAKAKREAEALGEEAVNA